jgi:hypothetical protein
MALELELDTGRWALGAGRAFFNFLVKFFAFAFRSGSALKF